MPAPLVRQDTVDRGAGILPGPGSGEQDARPLVAPRNPRIVARASCRGPGSGEQDARPTCGARTTADRGAGILPAVR